MNKTNKVLLVIVVLLVLIFGIGQFFSSAPSVTSVTGTNSSSTQTPQGPAPTNVIAYVPQPASSTPIEKGSCWTNSIAAPWRSDAWRCTVGNAISDPCFQIPGKSDLLCNVNPAVAISTSTFILQLTQALPAAEVLPGTAPANWAWLVELSDGTLCSPYTGTRPFTASGESANYGCAPGPLGDNLNIFGDLNASSSVWTADVGTLSQSTSSLPTIASEENVSVMSVWQ
jgi:hypothetical protein